MRFLVAGRCISAAGFVISKDNNKDYFSVSRECTLFAGEIYNWLIYIDLRNGRKECSTKYIRLACILQLSKRTHGITPVIKV